MSVIVQTLDMSPSDLSASGGSPSPGKSTESRFPANPPEEINGWKLVPREVVQEELGEMEVVMYSKVLGKLEFRCFIAFDELFTGFIAGISMMPHLVGEEMSEPKDSLFGDVSLPSKKTFDEILDVSTRAADALYENWISRWF